MVDRDQYQRIGGHLGMTSRTATAIFTAVLVAVPVAAAPSAVAAPITSWGDAILADSIWDGLGRRQKARVCHAYWDGGKRSIRQVIRLSTGRGSTKIDWSLQHAFEKKSSKACDRRKRR